jgi:3,4-dihydroxy 2-butanone 4-phosphate synthase / GTP cyclohydrolase II
LSADLASERHAAVIRAIDAVRNGRMVILVDDEDRENEGDLTMAADLVTPEAINFMAREGRGLICLSLTEERVNQLGLPMMTADNRARHHTAFTVSVDARRGTTTGISARERAETIRVAVARDARPDDLVIPGHIFPLRAHRGGVLVRSGQTEGSVDLARLAGREPAGVICEIMRDDGEMARMPDLEAFARKHDLPIVKIADLIEYRLGQELLVHPVSDSRVRPALGGLQSEYRLCLYTTEVEGTEFLALVLGEIKPDEPVLVRVQTAGVMRDVFGVGAAPDDHPATISLRLIEEAGKGVLLYVFPRGRVSLEAELGLKPTVSEPSDPRLRNFGLGAQVLAHLGVRTIRLLTNHPRRIVGIGGYGLEVVECVPIKPAARVVSLREGSVGSVGSVGKIPA